MEENKTSGYRPEIHIPNIITHSIAVLFGVPLNTYLIFELSIRAFKRKMMPQYAYYILCRCIVDLLIIFPRVLLDVLQALGQGDVIPNTLQQCMELFSLMLNLLTVTIWKIKSKSSSCVDKLILFIVPTFTISQAIIAGWMTVSGTMTGNDAWNVIGATLKVSRMLIFCVIYVVYFLSVRKPDSQFLTPFVLESHHRIVRFYMIDITVLLSIIILLCGRFTTIYIIEGKLSWNNPFRNIWGTLMEMYWSVTIVHPVIRAAATIVSFPHLLKNAFD